MYKTFITGCGLWTNIISSVNIFQNTNINEFPLLNTSSLCNQNKLPVIKTIAREDRALVNDIAQMAMVSSLEAFNMAERYMTFTEEEKENFLVYLVNETMPFKYEVFEQYFHKHNNGNSNYWADLGELKDEFNPLDMLRLLSTNPLYHVSKLFNLRGGGYPLRKMSLGSLSAIQDILHMSNGVNTKAILTAIGDLTSLDNLCYFQKADIVANEVNSDGIMPACGVASIILENNQNDYNLPKNYLAQIIEVRSHFKPDNKVTGLDWQHLLTLVPSKVINNKLNIITYDNGIKYLAENEMDAILQIFPKATVYNYKKYIGYTGKANNLIDLVLALSDKRIGVGEYVLINGVGNNAGLGYILIQKLQQLSGKK